MMEGHPLSETMIICKGSKTWRDMKRIWWKFGTLGFTVANLLLETIIGLGINSLLALLGGIAFCLQYLVAYFHYLGILSSTRSSILFQQNQVRHAND